MTKLDSVSSLRFLCALALLRETILSCLIVSTHAAHAEGKLVEPVVKKVQSQLDQIAGGVKGVMGLVVEDLGGEHRFAVNEDREFAQASAIKIPILMEVFKQA